MEKTKVIIVVAAYNNEKYIGELLDSLTSQSYRNIEIVVRDDGSSDNTINVINSRCRVDARIRILFAENNTPSAKSNFFTLLLNTQVYQGDYLMFCDADDVWKKDKVEKTLEAMREAEKQYGKDTAILIHTDLEVVDEELNTIADSLFSYEKLSPERMNLKDILVQNNVTGCTAMINSSLKKFITSHPSEAVMHDWWLALIAAAFGKIVVINEQTVLYRQHGDNQIGASDSGNLVNNIHKMSDRKHMREIYRTMYRQADCFLNTFGTKLSEAQYLEVKRYAQMEKLSKIGKIIRIISGRYYKNTFSRNIGQFIVV